MKKKSIFIGKINIAFQFLQRQCLSRAKPCKNSVLLHIPRLQGIRVCREMITFAAEKQPIGGMQL